MSHLFLSRNLEDENTWTGRRCWCVLAPGLLSVYEHELGRTLVSQNGWLLGRRGRSLPANASGLDTHRDSISSRFDCR
jgi:hypothetical protein